MNDNGWAEFWNSGSVSDYLKYKDREKEQAQDYGGFNKGIGNQTADNRGE